MDSPDDPITPEALAEAYRRHTTRYLERRLLEHQLAETYNRTRHEAIAIVLAERRAAVSPEGTSS